jgi:hypothetical protein
LQRFAEFGFARKHLGADVQLNLSKRCLGNPSMCTVAGRHAPGRRVDEFDSSEACGCRDTIWRLTPELYGAHISRAPGKCIWMSGADDRQPCSDGPALRRNIVRIMRALHDGHKRRIFQHYRVSLALGGTCENLRRDFSFHRGCTVRFGKHCGGGVKNCLHQFDKLGLKNCSCWLHGRLLG